MTPSVQGWHFYRISHCLCRKLAKAGRKENNHYLVEGDGSPVLISRRFLVGILGTFLSAERKINKTGFAMRMNLF